MSRFATNFTVIDQALVSGTNFITGLVLARILGIDAYGLFILLTGIIIFSSNIQNAVLISPMMVNGPAREQKASHEYYQTTTIMQGILTLILFFLIVLVGTLLNKTVLDNYIDNLILPLALAASGLLLQEHFRRYFFSTKQTIQALINDSISYGLQLCGIIAIHYLYSIDVKTCLYIMAATSFIAVFHGALSSSLLLKITHISLSDLNNVINEHWIFGKWLIARNITYWFGTQMVIYMTGIFLSVAAVGAMGATRNIVGIANILFLAIDNFATPRASNAYSQNGINGLSKYIKRLSVMGGCATASIALAASVAPDFWLNLIYPKEYLDYGWVVIAWAIFYLVGYFQRPFGLGLRVLGNTRSIFTGTLFSSVIVALLSYPSIIFGDLKGAMALLIVSQVSITIYYMFSYYKEKKSLTLN